MVNLAFWQLHRLQDKRDFNAEVRSRSSMPVAPFDQVVTDRITTLDDADQVEWRPVQVSGAYVATEQVIVVNKSQDGVPGRNVVTPLQLAGGELVLVNRGFVPETDPVPAPPTGSVTITGRLKGTEPRSFGGLTDPAEGELTELHRLDIDRLSQQLPGAVAPVYVELLTSSPASPNDPIPLPDPQLDEGPHLSYMMQWFIFSICAIVGWVLAIRRSARRRVIAAAAPAPSDSPQPSVDAPTTAPS
jgi:cytochrome oxidase assembly protein ShyY1